MESAWAVVSSISTMSSGQSSRGDRHGENSTEMLHSHPTRRRLLSRPVLSIHGAVTCLPSTTATTTTCPFFCEHTNPILTLSILLPTYYSTLIPTPHHSSLLPAACLPFTSATSHQPSAHALAVNFNPSKPSTQLDLLTPKHPSRPRQQSFAFKHLPRPLHFYFTTPPAVCDNASLRSCSCLAFPLYAPCRWCQLKLPETRHCPPGNLLVPTLPPLSVYLYTLSHNTAAPHSSPPYPTIPYAIVNHGHKRKHA
jgi:hypothetical protein